MKKCSRCKEDKPFAEFAKDSSRKDGYGYHCKVCRNEMTGKSYRNKTQTDVSYAPRDPNAEPFDRVEYRSLESTKVLRRISQLKWIKENRGYVNAVTGKRRATKKQATPIWYEHEEVVDLYKQARLLSEQSDTNYHIDHIVPLQHELVCGLHCKSNLQILTEEENLRKNNSFS